MNIQEIIKILTDAGIEPREAEAEVKLMIRDICKWSPVDIILERPIDMSHLDDVAELAKRRAQTGRPIQQILGFANFYGNRYRVTEDVLIPRDETELLVQKALRIIFANGFKTVLDIGTGSGCIACSIALNSETYVLGVDISSDALRIALENASALNLNNKAVFRKSDVYSKINPNETFDMIISNPPYIPEGTPVQKEVEFDPKLALFTKDSEGLEFYKRITEGAKGILKDGGYILFECGMGQARKIKKILAQNGFGNIEIDKDLAGIERVISAQLLS